MKRKDRNKKSKKQQLIHIFLKSVGIAFGVCVVGIVALGVSYKVFIYDGSAKVNNKSNKGSTIGKNSDQEEKDINKTVAVFGVDRDGDRTDVMFLVHFNSKTNQAKIVSLPRDTKIDWSDAEQKRLEELTEYQVSTSKINEMSHYAGIKNIREFTITHIENMLGVKIDNYALVTIDAFRKIVDVIGGVEVNVPREMDYEDPYQDLYIHLKPGLQVLDGKHAEMLVRFRKGYKVSDGYAEGDVGRIKTQQLFLEAFTKKIMSPEIALKFPQIVATLASSVTTDIPLSEIPEYYSYVKNFNLSNLKFGILPGEAQHLDRWYFIPDTTQIESFVNELFYDKVTINEPTTNEETVIEQK